MARDPDSGEPLDRSPLWSMEVAGHLVADPSPSWKLAAGRYWGHGLMGEAIDPDRYDRMVAGLAQCRDITPESPEADPRRRVDLGAAAPLF